MGSNLEARLVRLETLYRWVQDRIGSFTSRLDSLDNTTRQASGMQYNWGGSGSGGTGVYVAVTPSSGTWSGAAPPSGSLAHFTADVYKITGGAYSLVTSGATVYNAYPSSPANSKVVTLGANGDGTYNLIGESCT